MVKYQISRDSVSKDFVRLKLEFIPEQAKTILNLPFWRPGRYERADYHKRVKEFSAWNKSGVVHHFRTGDNTWHLSDYSLDETLCVSYLFYAKKIDAGSTWVDNDLLYANPVNCCMYPMGMEDVACELEVEVPNHWQIACGLPAQGRILKAENFDRLADSPFMASAELEHFKWKQEGIDIHLWFAGYFDLDAERLKKEFSAFFQVQFELFGSFPVKDYHFLFIFPEFKGYHGVEHINSTVIYLGPASEIKRGLYNDFLGVSSHELFHTWNVKNFRPKSMTPYDFEKENYSDLGYVYEGFTTYYGDLILARAGVFSKEEYFHELNVYIGRHALNYARFNISVAESSRTTWVDGYENFTPWRKTSIYVEGAMNALLLDILLRKKGKSLDDVLRSLYNNEQSTANGYDKEDLVRIVSSLAGEDFGTHFEKYYDSPADLIPVLNTELNWFGCGLKEVFNSDLIKRDFGLELSKDLKVIGLCPGSPAAISGLCLGDEILTINGWRANIQNIHDRLQDEPAMMSYAAASGRIKETQLQKRGQLTYFSTWEIVQIEEPNARQKDEFQSWCGLPFD